MGITRAKCRKKKILWRACHDILPTRANLVKRNIVDDPECPICEREVETGFHILWQCPSAMDAWCLSSRNIQKRSFPGPDFVQVVEGVLAHCSTDEIKIFVGLARRIWLRRNEVVYGGSLTHPSILLHQTQTAVAEFKQASIPLRTPNVTLDEQPTHWMQPQLGWMKLNWDAGINRSQGCTGFGLVLYDWMGRLVAVQCVSRQGLLAPLAAELTGALLAVQFCRSMGLERVHFEGDAKIAVEAINSLNRDMSNLGHLVDDVRTVVRGISLWQFTFIRRDGNRAAHLLSKFAASHALDKTWNGETPACLEEIICLEQIAQAL